MREVEFNRKETMEAAPESSFPQSGNEFFMQIQREAKDGIFKGISDEEEEEENA